MIRVFADREPSGILSRYEDRGTSFVSVPGVPAARGVSLTMPVRPNSWEWPFGMLPIFEMNLPEGALRLRLERQFAKSMGRFDALDLLALTGRHQIGRLEYGGDGKVQSPARFHSVDEILRARRDGDLFDYLMQTYAEQSGLSGVQPKVMVRDEGKFSLAAGRQSLSLSAATHIVKLWEPGEYPALAANEYFCLLAARAAGLPVPLFELSENGQALVVERFDLTLGEGGEGVYLGFEDFCVLNGVNTDRKYDGSYETRLFKRAADFISPVHLQSSLRQLFKLLVFNTVIRNGDAHLKNFGVLYDAIYGDVRLAPAYDLVTTTAYLPNDGLALTLGGSTRWPGQERLTRTAITHAGLGPAEIRDVLGEVRAGAEAVLPDMQFYFSFSEHKEIGKAMTRAWQDGLAALG